MKYVSIDIETTGLDRERCQILEFGAVIEDTLNPLPLDQLPALRVLIRHQELHWEDYCLDLHRELMKEFDDPESTATFCSPVELAGIFRRFLLKNGFPEEHKLRIRLNVAGKNFCGFDREFLERLPYWKSFFSISKRVLDPAMLYVDFKTDEVLPDLEICKRRANLWTEDDIKVKHTAIADALDVVELLRKFYY